KLLHARVTQHGRYPVVARLVRVHRELLFMGGQVPGHHVDHHRASLLPPRGAAVVFVMPVYAATALPGRRSGGRRAARACVAAVLAVALCLCALAWTTAAQPSVA